MTGKQLKAFAEQVPDESMIEVRERSYGSWTREFEMQANYAFKSKPSIAADDEPVPMTVSAE